MLEFTPSFLSLSPPSPSPPSLPCPAEWSENEVVEKYLRPINMEHLAKLFTENRINGAVLMALEVRKECVGVRECLREEFILLHNG